MQFDISEGIQHWAVYRKSSIAIRCESKSISYLTLNRRVDRIAAALRGVVRRPGRVGLMIADKSDFLVALIGILRSGNSVVILNQVLDPRALQQSIADAKVTNLIVDDHFDKVLRGITKSSVTLKKLLFRKNDLFHDGLKRVRSNRTNAIANPTDEWGVFYSSGTTGIPKGIERDRYSVVTELLGWCLELGLDDRTHFYIGRPLFYTGGLVLSLATLLVGGCIGLDHENDWLAYRFHPKKCDVDFAFLVPDQLREFVRCAKQSGSPKLAAKRILVMGGYISAEEKREAARVLHSEVIESWGNSEGLGTITTPQDLRDRPQSIGRPFLTDRMYIVDRRGKPLPPGRIGRIAGGVEAGFSRYCNKPKATNAARTKGLIVSDDYGYMDVGGYFYIVGRSEDLLPSAGRPVFTNTIEVPLRLHPSVRECAVVNLGTRRGPVVLVGIVVLEISQKSTDDILRNVNRRLNRKFQLHSIIAVDSLPRNAAGKVDKIALQELAK
jgi:acyl-coenzyme A synthetase/AMP-(fatty) acid ligase